MHSIPISFRASRTAVCTFALLALGTTPILAAPIAFEAHVEYSVAQNPLDATMADFNGDGLVDIAVTNTNSFTEPYVISILRNAGSGTFNPAMFVETTEVPRCLSAGDVDDDGDQDIVVGFQSGDYRIGILHNSGAGDFGSAQLLALIPGRADAVKAIDLDADDDLDIVIAQAGGEEIVVLENEGAGSFAEAVAYGGISSAYFAHLAVGDVDGDGDPDLALGRSLAVDTQSIYRNQGDGTFASPEAIDTPMFFAGNDLGDVDGDHDLDLVLVNESGPSVLLMVNDGLGIFTAAGTIYSGAETQLGTELTVADLDQDGLADAMLVGANTPRVATLRSNGSGFEPAVFHALGWLSRRVHAADLDGDHDADLVATLFESDQVSVLLNQAASATPVAAGPALSHALAFGPAMPNPMRVATSIPLVLPGPSNVRVSIVDVRGRLVRTLSYGPRSEGRSMLSWDGQDARGDRVPPGVYFATLETTQDRRIVRIAILD